MFSIHFTSSNEKTKYKMLDSVIPTEVVKRYVWFNDEDVVGAGRSRPYFVGSI